MKRNNKRGFTLVEMMLAIAITLIISGFFVTLLVSIRTSYYRTYNDDDCADIAALYAEALENTVLYDIQNGVTDTITIDPDTSILTNTRHSIVFPSGFNNADADKKWEIRMLCAFDNQTGEFQYSFYFVDCYIQPGYLHYVYQGSFWIPTYADFVQHTVGNGDEVAPGETNTWDYNYRSTVIYEYHPQVSPEATIGEDGSIGPSTLYTTSIRLGGRSVDVHSRMSSDNRGIITADGDVVSIPAASSEISIVAGASRTAPSSGPSSSSSSSSEPSSSEPSSSEPSSSEPSSSEPSSSEPSSSEPSSSEPSSSSSGGSFGGLTPPPEPTLPPIPNNIGDGRPTNNNGNVSSSLTPGQNVSNTQVVTNNSTQGQIVFNRNTHSAVVHFPVGVTFDGLPGNTQVIDLGNGYYRYNFGDYYPYNLNISYSGGDLNDVIDQVYISEVMTHNY